MATFHIQDFDGSITEVGHGQFFETLNEGNRHIYYKQGGKHLALLPTAENEESLRISRQHDNAENAAIALANRCRDEKGRVCRTQHDEKGRVIRNSKGQAIVAKCSECPRDGWQAGKRENCCIRNYCTTEDCVCCPYPRESHMPLSLGRLAPESKNGQSKKIGEYELADPRADIQSIFEEAETKAELHNALSALPELELKLLAAVYWDRLTLSDFAEANGISKSKAGRLHKRALETLRNILKKTC